MYVAYVNQHFLRVSIRARIRNVNVVQTHMSITLFLLIYTQNKNV